MPSYLELSDARLAELFLPDAAQSLLFLLTGPRGSGKTRLCQHLQRVAHRQGATTGGVISPAVMRGTHKIGVNLALLPGEETLSLAYLRDQPHPAASTKYWRMDERSLARGNAHLARLAPPDLLIIDELGPLEFEDDDGLTAAFALIDARAWRWAVVVVRPSLLDAALARWPWARIIDLSGENAA